MCTIERFDVVYPNGRRETRERVVNCPRGTRTRPCSQVEVVPLFEDRPATASDQNSVRNPRYHASTPRKSQSPGSRPRSKDKPKSPASKHKSKTLFDELAVVFKFWKPFPSKKPKKKRYFVREEVIQEDTRPAIVHHYPRAPTPPPRMPRRGRSPNIVPIAPRHETSSPPPRSRERERRHRRRHHPSPIVVQVLQSSEEDDSPSPPTPARDHHRKSRSISPRSKRETEQKYIRDKERRSYAERVATEENEARKRAARIARIAEFDRLEKERIKRERLEYEEMKRIESVERARKRQQQEEYERTQAKRRQQLEDLERLNAAARAQQRQEESDRRRQEERERHRLEEEERLARARRANIPRRPRHQPAVHHQHQQQQRESMEDRGERFIREAIRQDNLRQFEREAAANAGRPRRTYDDDDGGLRRRDTIGGGWRGGYSGRRERRDRRSD